MADTQAANAVGAILAVTVFAVPFDAILNVQGIGELAHESYIIINLACAPVVLLFLFLTNAIRVPKSLLVVLSLIILTVFVSFAANSVTILSAVAKGRQGLDKLVTSTLVPIFGMYTALLIYNAASWNFKRWFLLPLLASAVVVLLVGAVELASSRISGLSGLSARLYIMTHSGFGTVVARASMIETMAAGTTRRVTSVLFEPSDFGAYLIYVTPWLLALYLSPVVARRSMFPALLRHLFYLPLICLALVLAFFSGRTAGLGLPAIVIVFLGLCVLIKLFSIRGSFGIVSGFIVTFAVILYSAPIWLIGIFLNELVTAVINSGNTSNLSRFGTVVILLDLFRDNTPFGVGFGQYGFYVAQYVPGWAYTYEFKRWLGDLNSSFFPTFSVFPRLAGETGLFGLAIWIGFLAYLLAKVTKNVRHSYVAHGQFPYFGIALMTNFFSLGLVGLSMASFRIFWIWAMLGLAACYIYRPSTIELEPGAR